MYIQNLHYYVHFIISNTALNFQRLFIITRRHRSFYENWKKKHIMPSDWLLNFHTETGSEQ